MDFANDWRGTILFLTLILVAILVPLLVVIWRFENDTRPILEYRRLYENVDTPAINFRAE